ncbi:GNAT family N-acetyltransferase [Luteimonas sp. SDU82]|uniref:GNAT family N-acetyltransferase n=1 Tax=Luteimonas sp. SDU82 TaxID=3422592 RepID=UPI003EC0F238
MDSAIQLRDAGHADLQRILALNRREQQHTSALELSRLEQLHALAWHHRVAVADGEVVAFLLAMRDGAAYDGENFAWFAARWRNFAYIDRIVVDPGHGGRGIARRLYEELFALARQQGLDLVACEYNIKPPNPASRAFHQRLGFSEAGRQYVADGSKQVSMQTRTLTGDAAGPSPIPPLES